jgi:hypothetical protein
VLHFLALLGISLSKFDISPLPVYRVGTMGLLLSVSQSFRPLSPSGHVLDRDTPFACVFFLMYYYLMIYIIGF